MGREGHDDDAAKCDAILATKSKIPDKQGTVAGAKMAFQNALEQELSVKQINGGVFVTNQDGASYVQAKMAVPNYEKEVECLKDRLQKVTKKSSG